MPMYFYTPMVPQANQQKNVSQPIMQANFQAINELITQNHVGFNTANFGKHTVVTLTSLPSSPVTTGTDNAIYNLVSAQTGINETFWHNQSINGPFDFPVTANIFSTTQFPGLAGVTGSQGWCYLPSGLIMKWGTFAKAAIPFVFPTSGNIPAFTYGILSLQLTVGDTAGVPGSPESVIYKNNTLSTTGFDYIVFNTTANTQISYLAIGY